MPLFEYRCGDCGTRFERFVAREPSVSCPGCESTSVAKLLSVFAVGGGNGGGAASAGPDGGCGSCGDPRGPGACAMDSDR